VNWDGVGAIAELAGSVAVIISLGYLAVQIRRSSLDSQRSMFFSVRSQVQQFRAMIAQDSEVARIYRDGLSDLDGLAEEDRWRFGALMQYEFSFFEDTFRLRLDSELFHDNTDNLRWLARRPGARSWWKSGSRLYHPEFRRHVDALLSEGDITDSEDVGALSGRIDG
jgi:hypothetical protein